jgi:hypothetical protein
MSTRKGFLKYRAKVTVITNPRGAWRTVDHHITVRVPEGTGTSDIQSALLTAAAKRWRNCWIQDIQRFWQVDT